VKNKSYLKKKKMWMEKYFKKSCVFYPCEQCFSKLIKNLSNAPDGAVKNPVAMLGVNELIIVEHRNKLIPYHLLDFRMHYRVYYALYLHENSSVTSVGQLQNAFSNYKGQQSIMRYQ
jgi:hypothetical protein